MSIVAAVTAAHRITMVGYRKAKQSVTASITTADVSISRKPSCSASAAWAVCGSAAAWRMKAPRRPRLVRMVIVPIRAVAIVH